MDVVFCSIIVYYRYFVMSYDHIYIYYSIFVKFSSYFDFYLVSGFGCVTTIFSTSIANITDTTDTLELLELSFARS